MPFVRTIFSPGEAAPAAKDTVRIPEDVFVIDEHALFAVCSWKNTEEDGALETGSTSDDEFEGDIGTETVGLTKRICPDVKVSGYCNCDCCDGTRILTLLFEGMTTRKR